MSSSNSDNKKQKTGQQALAGLKVVELGHLISGPYCAKLLADLGAEVIKIEEPGTGDQARAFAPFLNDIPHPERSALFSYLNTNKLSITLDVKTAIGKEILHRLLGEADILVENNPPLLMAEWGLSYDSLSKRHPRLIMTSITPFGQTGPYRDYKGGELITYHVSGGGHTTPRFAEAGQAPLRLGGRLTEFYTGQSAAVATMCAIWARERTGEGQQLDISAQESFINNCWAFFTYYIFDNDIVTRLGRPRWAPMAVLPCKDGYVSFQFQSEAQWQSLVEVMGHPDWAENELFKDQWSRADNWDALSLLMGEWLSQHGKQEFFHAAQAKRCPVGPVNTAEDVLNSEHLAAREFFVEIEHPEIGKMTYPSAPYKLSGTPWRLECPAPLLGQHNESIYCQRLSYKKKDLVKMRGLGII